VAIAYRVVEGDGPPVVVIPGFASNVAEIESLPTYAAWRPIVEATRWVMLDKRGTGLSDRAVGVADLQARMDDVRAVMDEVGLDRAHLLGVSEGGPMSILFAATYPDRVLSLTLVGSFARFTRSPSHPWMPTPEERAVTRAQAVEFWGTGWVLATMFDYERPSAEELEGLARLEMAAASPDAVSQIFAMNQLIDVGDVLATVRVPTLGTRLREAGLEVRAGLHTGEIELRGDDIGGLAVHVAARVAGLAGAGEVLVSRTVKDLTVGSDIAYVDRGEHELKGVPDRWPLYEVAR